VTDIAPRTYNVLFLCTGNSARSLLAEAALGRLGAPRYRAFSAGSEPKDAPHPETLATLKRLYYDTGGFRSKSWDEFAGDDSPEIDFVLTVCGNAAAETCPVWPGRPTIAHWGVEDPAAFVGAATAKAKFFEKIYEELLTKVEALVALDPATCSLEEFSSVLREIGER
jgi:protein-tyrosine-phosphatase